MSQSSALTLPSATVREGFRLDRHPPAPGTARWLSSDEVVAPDAMFAGLDNRAIELAGDIWRIQVFGVVDEGVMRWVQLGVDATGRSIMMTAKMTVTDRPELLLFSLRTALAGLGTLADTLHVTIAPPLAAQSDWNPEPANS